MTKKRKWLTALAVVGVLLLGLVIWSFWETGALELNTYTIESQHLPKSFDGYRIAQVSDLHNTQMGQDNEKLLAMLRDAQPDMIAITGDLIDCRNTDVEVALRFAQEAVKIAPCYYVTGNHEGRSSEYETLRSGLQNAGVVILEDRSIKLERNGTTICLMGIHDLSMNTIPVAEGEENAAVQAMLERLRPEQDTFTVLLVHRPTFFEAYAQSELDLVLTGHTHAGQIRLPFVGNIYVLDQGFFPEYDTGLYTQGQTNMIISRGVGSTGIPLRFNNRPEVVLVELVHQP